MGEVKGSQSPNNTIKDLGSISERKKAKEIEKERRERGGRKRGTETMAVEIVGKISR